MTNLITNYLGIELKNPLVASASPLSENVESVKNLERAGISAVVMHSLFEEQITKESMALDHYMEQGTDSYAEALGYPEPGINHFAITVKDIEATFEVLNQKGFHVGYIYDYIKDMGSSWVAYIDPADTGGILIEIVQEK